MYNHLSITEFITKIKISVLVSNYLKLFTLQNKVNLPLMYGYKL